MKFNIMKKITLFIVLSVFMSCIVPEIYAQPSKAARAGWLLGAQSYTFNKFTFVETLDKMQQLGLKYVEVYFGQKLGEGFEGNMDFNMNPETRTKILELAKSKGITIMACGVVICNNEAEWRRLFDFAKAMGIKVITSEPAANDLDLVEKLADQYNIDVAFHNHPQPSPYWNPDLLLTALKGRSKHMGSCADVGHWKRMGIDPVEALKKLEGRIRILHFKDIAEGGAKAHDVIWGQGVCNVEGMLKELKRQHFKGMFSIEYEYNEENPVPDMTQCITNFQTITNKLF
jgi:sugar phosphate isomerase/epimerase